jgi:uncharacterized protein (TIGR04255 family)
MVPEQPYPNAPITEALIDIRVSHQQGISLEKLKKFGAEVRGEYPNESPRDILQGQIDFSMSSPQTQSSRTTVGYIFHSIDRRQAVQARLDGFTFSRFAPYQDWHRLIDEARRLWTVYVATLGPTAALRIAVRYVNQINLPLAEGTLNFEDYLRTFPKMDIDGDVLLQQFFLRLVMPQEDLSAQLILTESLLPPQGSSLGIILDIDLFRENLSLDVRTSGIWDMLEQFRARKNKYFEASITDKTRKLFA